MASSEALSFWSGLALGAGIVAASAWLLCSQGKEQSVKQAENSKVAQKKQEDIHFEFYRMLPELDVVIPDDIEKQPVRPALLSKEQKNEQLNTRQKIESLPGSYYLQTGSFSDRSEAEKMKARISLLGYEVSIQSIIVNGKRYHRVRIGPFAQLDELNEAKQTMKSNRISFIAVKASG